MKKRQRLKRDPMNQPSGKVRAWAKRHGFILAEQTLPVCRPKVVGFERGVFHPDTHGRRRQRAWKNFEKRALAGHGFYANQKSA